MGRAPLLWLAFAVLCLSWSSTWLLAKYALAYTPPMMLVGLRSFIGGMLLWAACGFVAMPCWRVLWPGAVLMTVVNFGLMAWGLTHVPSGLGATVNLGTIPLAVLVFSASGMRMPQIAGLLIGLGGLAALFVASAEGADRYQVVGILAIAAGAASYGLGTVMVKAVSPTESPMRLAAWHSLVGGALLLMLSGLFEPWNANVLTDMLRPKAIFILTAIVMLSTVIGLSLYLALLRHWTASAVASYAYVCPMLALFLGAVVGGEHLELRQLLACAALIVAAALILSSSSPGRTRI